MYTLYYNPKIKDKSSLLRFHQVGKLHLVIKHRGVESPKIPITQLPPAPLRVRDWGSRNAAWWQRVVFFALIAPVAIPVHLVWRVLVAGWRELWPGPPEYSSEIRNDLVHWYERGRVIEVSLDVRFIDEAQRAGAADMPISR